MRKKNNFISAMVLAWVITTSLVPVARAQEQEDYKILREIILNEFQKEVPTEHGVNLSGVLRRFETTEKKVALVLGACLDQGAEVDRALFQVIQDSKVPASLFLDHGWLQKNSEQVKALLSTGFVQLENHGTFCRSLSTTGKGPKNHPGTSGVDEVFEEIEKNARGIESVSGRLPRFFNAGYDFYDDVSLKIISVLGYIAIQCDLKLRASDVATDASLKTFLAQVKPGSMILIPANRPGTAAIWLPHLLKELSFQGYQIAALDEVINVTPENS